MECVLLGQVGDGKSINIWDDSWIRYFHPSLVVFLKPHQCSISLVSELINSYSGTWNRASISQLFSKENANLIANCPLGLFPSSDRLVWILAPNGSYGQIGVPQNDEKGVVKFSASSIFFYPHPSRYLEENLGP